MYDVYTITNGDTVESIAIKYNTSPSVIYQINNLNQGAYLTPGTTIIVPKKTNDFFNYYTVTKGDSLFKIASDNNIDYKLLAVINGLNVNDYIYPNQSIMIPKSGVKFYLTKKGDTLNDVIKAFNANVNDLVRQNNKIYLLEEQLVAYKS